MNPDTDPIAEVEAWLIGRRYPYPACLDERIGPTIDEALAFLPAGWRWACTLYDWTAYPPGPVDGSHIEFVRSKRPEAAHAELLRLAAKALMKEETK